MNVIAVQLDIAWENPRANVRRVAKLLEVSPPAAGAMVVLPETFATGFSTAPERVAEGPSGVTESSLADLARRYEVAILAGLSVRTATGLQNQAVAFGPEGQVIARYAKLHRFSYAGEQQHYDAGSEIVLFDWQGVRVAPFICYDLRFPEIFRIAARRGAQCLVVIANWPAVREAHWTALLPARAIENQAYVVGVNRCGTDPKLAYSGRSMIIDPRGQVLTDAGSSEGVIEAELDMAALADYRRTFPALTDSRGEFLGE